MKDLKVSNVKIKLSKKFDDYIVKDEAFSFCSTGIVGIDSITGGGIPKGLLVELFGKEGCGKSSLCLHIASQVLKKGGICFYIDGEGRLSLPYAKSLGVSGKGLVISRPPTMGIAFDVLKDFLEGLEPNEQDVLIVYDSLVSLPLQEEMDVDSFEDSKRMAMKAGFLSQNLPVIASLVRQKNAMLIFVNQLRDNPAQAWGSSEYTPGGRAMKFYSSLRLGLKAKKMDVENAFRVIVKVEKSSIGIPFRTAELVFYLGRGFDRMHSLYNFMGQRKMKAIKKYGKFEEFKDACEKDGTLLEKLETECMTEGEGNDGGKNGACG